MDITEHNSKIVEAVARGVRAMKCAPDAFIFSPIFDWEWDREEILGIPVFHLDYPERFAFYNDSHTEQCPFCPIWKEDRSIEGALSRQFFNGYLNCGD